MTACYSQHFQKEEKYLLKHIHINTSTGLWEKVDPNTLKCSNSVSSLLYLYEFRLIHSGEIRRNLLLWSENTVTKVI